MPTLLSNVMITLPRPSLVALEAKMVTVSFSISFVKHLVLQDKG